LTKKIAACLLMIALLLSLITPVYASDDVEMLGTFSDKFELTSDGDKLFDLTIMNPGDVWDNKLEIKNHTGEKMEVRLLEVVNKIEDALMFDILNVKIYFDDELYYEGPYNKIPTSEWIPVENGEKIIVKVVLEFPGECGNEYQNKPFDSEWKFEARLPEPSQPSDPEEPPVPTGVVRGFYVAGMICLGSFILFILLGKKKDEEDDKKSC
jgi:hypothetical protein